MAGEPVRGIASNVGFVFQQDAVFPWRSVLSNVMAGPRFRGVPKPEAKERAREWLARVGLSSFEDRYPHQLSGGQRKRVALASTFVNDPEILLMDEPFSALDVQTRALMSDELLELWAVLARVVFVTHDLEESIALADKVVVMTAGPATVKEVFEIDLPRPRKVESVRLEPRSRDLPGDPGPRSAKRSASPVRGVPSMPETISATAAPALDKTPGTRTKARARAARNRAILVQTSRALVLLGVIGLWEWLARAAVIDPFNFSMPSKIWDQLEQWALHGTAQGSLWEQIGTRSTRRSWAGASAWWPVWSWGSRSAGSPSSPMCSARTSRCSTRCRASSSRPSS
ncbi:Vitamin B12 import ATP-binding protein BtuD [Streptomyces antimycoticus]